jgi:enoyl-CoA hydratase
MIRVMRSGAVGRITLDRPSKINALTPEMLADLHATLEAWEREADLRLVLLDGAGPRGFCAGGDLRLLRDLAAFSHETARGFWADEYRLDAKLASFAKPIVAFMSGIVMGGGVGLTAHTRHRIVSESTELAMPEAAVGLIPDVGATWLLSRAPSETGTYLALTGERIGAGDALALGLADAFVPQADLEALGAALVREAPSGDDAVRAVIGRFARAPGTAPLWERRAEIEALFAHDTVEAIVAALWSDGSAFALETVRTMGAKSPTSLKLTLRALREARDLAGLPECLQLEYRVMSRILAGFDFYEGTRAVVIDKDRTPAWRPAALRDVSPAAVAQHFAPLGNGELRL